MTRSAAHVARSRVNHADPCLAPRGGCRGRHPPARTLTLLDVQAVAAFLIDEPAAHDVEALLRAPDACGLVAINVAEVIDVLVRHRARDPEEIAERLDWLKAGGLETIPVDDLMARRAGILRARHYHRSRCPVSIADCTVLAGASAPAGRCTTAEGSLSYAWYVRIWLGRTPTPAPRSARSRVARVAPLACATEAYVAS